MQIESIEEWIGRDIVDCDDAKVGKLSEVYFDDERPVIGEVRTGRFSKRLHLVPLLDAQIARDHLRVPYQASLIEAGPSPSPGELTAAELQGVEANYQLRLDPDLAQDGRLESWGARRARLEHAAALQRELEQLESESVACEARVREADEAVAEAQRQAAAAHREHERARTALAEARERLRL